MGLDRSPSLMYIIDARKQSTKGENMRIDTHRVNAARKVLKAISHHLAKMPKGRNNLSLDHYQNGREQGFIITNFPSDYSAKSLPKWVAFSENRDSDHIVVYTSRSNTWTCPPMQGMTDEAWKNRILFQYDETEKAAKYCVEFLVM